MSDEVVLTSTKTVRLWIEPRTVYVIHADDGRPRAKSEFLYDDLHALLGESWVGTETAVCDSIEEAQACLQRRAARPDYLW